MNVEDNGEKQMETEKKKRLSEVIRDVIRAIPPKELPTAKPSKVLPGVEEAGFEITPSVRSTVSKLLKKAKEGNNPHARVKELPYRIADRTDLAMKLVEACGGDFSLVRTEIDRLEKFAKSIKGTGELNGESGSNNE